MQNSSMAATTDRKAKMAVDEKATEKISEKVAEKRRALGRGLESLLPGPRVVPGSAPATAAKSLQTSSSQSAPAAATSAGVSEPEAPHSGEEGVGVARLRTDVGRADAGSSLGMTSGEQTQDAVSSSGEASSVAMPPGVSPAPRAGTEVRAVAASTSDGEEVLRLKIDLIDNNPHQTRRVFNETALQELADSIKMQGVVQPILVRQKEERYVLILGERRLRASILAGFDTIPAVVRRVSDQRAAEMTLVENLQRQDLNCVEQAEAFANLSQKFRLTQEQIGAQVGVSRQSVANYMRILTLADPIILALQKGKLTFSHARVLLMVSDEVARWKIAQRALEENLSVAQLEDLVQGLFVPRGFEKDKKPGSARWVDPNVKAAQRSLEEVLGMRVRIRDRQGRGKILIEYGTIEDFDRVVRMLSGK